ncbi:sulfite exporter TauE/SafE family protein [Scopulibacillus cellulosilyticus]|uniref:Probable membrane transporter protein n=1 Tax=Scopulibacillus cellulosilyticus TaxID=2665665 RepID=A0ABW2PZ25_9BACL
MSIEIIIIGFIVGGLVGLTGVGGASLLTPFLIFLGINPTIAIGTDFAYNTITKMFAAFQHVKQKTVDLKLVKYLAFGSLPAAVIANLIFYFFLSDYYSEKLIVLFLGIVLIVVSLTALVQLVFFREINSPWRLKPIREKRNITIIAGMVIGAVVGITSVGAGSLFALFILFFYNRKSSEVVGTDIVHAFFLVLVTGLLMAGYGHINYVLTGNLLIGSIPGTIIASKLTKKIPSSIIRVLIVIIILFSGIKLIMNG